MNAKIDSINQILSNTSGGKSMFVEEGEDGKKAKAIQLWMTSVLRKVIYYKAEHNRSLKVSAAAFQPFVPNDIVSKNVSSFFELPSHTFEGESELPSTNNSVGSDFEDDNGERKRRRTNT